MILGFDTSTAVSAACVLREDGVSFEVRPEPGELLGPPSHARDLMPAIARVMEEAGAEFGDLAAVAVGVGPGTFTGLRIGIATARALAGANGLELKPVSSLAALAAGIEGRLTLPLIDAKRGEVFAALLEQGEPRWAPFAAPPEQVGLRLGCSSFGRLPPFSVRSAGDGSVRFRGVLEAAGIGVDPDESRSHVVRALHVCRLAAEVPGEPPQSVLPDYLRAPDAKPQ